MSFLFKYNKKYILTTLFFLTLILFLILLLLLTRYYNNNKSTIVSGSFNNKTVYKLTLNEKKNIEKTILKKVLNVCNKLDIPCFLSSGTCLGYYRNNDFIDYDYDLDIGIPIDKYKKEIVSEMINEGFVHYRTLGDIKTGLEESFRLPNTKLGPFAKVDIFPHYIEKKNNKTYYTWYTYKTPLFKEKIKYRVPYFKLKNIKFKDMDVLVPDPTDKYLVNHYGDDWMIPKQGVDYQYHTSPVSIVK
jgi:fukutin